MTVDLSALDSAPRLLFTIELRALQGERFQPTGFPSLGAATYQTSNGTKLLVESAQSMANRFETTSWDPAANAPITAMKGISHVRVDSDKNGTFLTDSMLEAHRINSPYLLENKKDTSFISRLKADLGGLEAGPIDRKKLAATLLKFDAGSLVHGVFLAKKELAGGRLRVARALSAFIEASNARVAASGGVKNDHVNPRGSTKEGFGNVPFARDEFTADRIDLFVNLDLAQLRGYGLNKPAERLLVLIALHRLRKLVDGDLRLRTACDLEPANREDIRATRPDFRLPSLTDLSDLLQAAIVETRDQMVESTVVYDEELKAAKDDSKARKKSTADSDDETDDEPSEE